jgi:hypothetical protein
MATLRTRVPSTARRRLLSCLVAAAALGPRAADAQVPMLLQANIDARPRPGAAPIPRIWNTGHISFPYAVFDDVNWEVGVDLPQRWIAANFPFLSHVLIANFLLGHTSTRPPWLAAGTTRVEEIWTASHGLSPLWDRYIANCIRSGVFPLVSLTGTPREMVQGTPADWPDAYFYHVIEPPASSRRDAWGTLIETLYRRYDAMGYEPSRWKWATWMEPGLRARFVGSHADYVDLALRARAALDRASAGGPRPELRLGNFLSPLPTSYPYVPLPGDIQSWAQPIMLQTQLPGVLGGTATSLFHVEPKDQGFRFLSASLDRMRELCVLAGVPDYPVHVDEYGILFYYHAMPGLPLGGGRWIPALNGEPALNCASWHAMMLHLFLDRGVTSCAPFFMDQYWRGESGSGSSSPHQWMKLAFYNTYDLFEELVGLERIPLGFEQPYRKRSLRNGMETIGRVSAVAGRDDRHTVAVFYNHGDVMATDTAPIAVNFDGLRGNTRYFAEVYRVDEQRGSVFDRMLRDWVQRAQRLPTSFRLPNGTWSWDLSARRRFDFYYQDPANWQISGWCAPLGSLPPTFGANEFRAAGLDRLVSASDIPRLQRLDDFYLFDARTLETDAFGGTGFHLELPMHAVALVRLTAQEDTADLGTLRLSFEKDLESAEGHLPTVARALSYDRGVETPLAWQGSHRHPGIDWTDHDTARHPRGIYPPGNPRALEVGNGTDAHRALRFTSEDGARPELRYEDHPLNPMRGSIDLWFRPSWGSSGNAIGDDQTGATVSANHVLLHCAERPGRDELLVYSSGGNEVFVRWMLDGVQLAFLRVPFAALGTWNDTWQRLTIQWSYDLGRTNEFRVAAIGNGQTILSTRPRHVSRWVTGPTPFRAPLCIGRHAYDASMQPWEGMIDELRISAVPNAYFP